MAADTAVPLEKERHVKYWQRCHKTFLPHQYTSHDSTRMALSFFIIAALDILSPSSPSGHLLTDADRTNARNFVLSLQHPDGGFCGSATHALPKDLYTGWDFDKGAPKARHSSSANIAATYFALLILAMVADGPEGARTAFAGVDRAKTLRWLKRLQRSEGSFGELVLDDGRVEGGRDMRLCYLAAAIRWMLRGDMREGDPDWVEDIDVEGLIGHVRRGQTYDGGLAESSQLESHGMLFFMGGGVALVSRKHIGEDG